MLVQRLNFHTGMISFRISGSEHQLQTTALQSPEVGISTELIQRFAGAVEIIDDQHMIAEMVSKNLQPLAKFLISTLGIVHILPGGGVAVVADDQIQNGLFNGALVFSHGRHKPEQVGFAVASAQLDGGFRFTDTAYAKNE